MNIVILGAGGIAHTHAQALQHGQAFNLLGVCGNNATQTQEFADQYGISAYHSLDNLLADNNVQAVSICTPSGLHLEHGLAIARSGKHVLTEKPIALNVADAQLLIDICQQHNVYIGAFFQRRLEADVIRLKQLIDSGELGHVFHLALQMNWYRAPEYYASGGWRGTWRMDGGGALMNQSIHYVDMVCHLLGEPTEIFAKARTCLHDIEVDDLTMAIWQFTGGTTCTYQVTTAAYPGFETRIEVYGTKGSATMVNEQLMSINTLDGQSYKREQAQHGAVSTPAVAFDNHAKLYQAFADKLAVDPTFDEQHSQELLRPNKVIAAIYESSKSNAVVKLGDR